MKKKAITTLLVIAFAAIFTLGLSACGGGDDEGGGGGGGTTQNELTAANWRSSLNETFGLDITMPAGWTFSDNSQKSTNSFDLRFTTSAEDFDTEYEDLVSYIFDLTESIVPTSGNFDKDIMGTSVYRGKYDDVPTFWGSLYPIWYFNTAKGCYQMSIDDAPSSKTAQIYITATGSQCLPGTAADGFTYDGETSGEGWPLSGLIAAFFPGVTIPQFNNASVDMEYEAGDEWGYLYLEVRATEATVDNVTDAMTEAYGNALKGAGFNYSETWGYYSKDGVYIFVTHYKNFGEFTIRVERYS